MVDQTAAQIRGLQNKTEAWTPQIQQINVPEANIVDRCESCHMGIREPVKLTAASMSLKGKKPDERSEEHTSELQSQSNLVCRLLLEKKNTTKYFMSHTPLHEATHSRSNHVRDHI